MGKICLIRCALIGETSIEFPLCPYVIRGRTCQWILSFVFRTDPLMFIIILCARPRPGAVSGQWLENIRQLRDHRSEQSRIIAELSVIRMELGFENRWGVVRGNWRNHKNFVRPPS